MERMGRVIASDYRFWCGELLVTATTATTCSNICWWWLPMAGTSRLPDNRLQSSPVNPSIRLPPSPGIIPTMSATTMVTRNEWGARTPKLVEKFLGPSPYVIIHHSYQPAACNSTENCKAAMRSMQIFHQDDRGWNDIGYSFAVGGDGKVYQGRGFNVVGAHAPGYNSQSVGICLIGDWRTELPSEDMLNATRDLIRFGVKHGYIHKEYKLLGHRQVRDTECPGDALFNEIKSWSNFAATPSKLKENEIPT